ncbi:hypothetical protein ACI79P_16225 [Blastococcus sp. SYSU DS0510]
MVEPVVADGGEVILCAPHIRQIAAMHPEIEEIGYLRGAGTWDEEHGERCRLTVTLATGIPEDVVRRASLGYLDPADVDVEASRSDGETLVVPEAGEVLFRLR